MKRGILLISLFLAYTFSAAQVLTSTTEIAITKTWSEQPDGYTYPIAIKVPTGDVPDGGFPVCIALHGNGGQGQGMAAAFSNTLPCHIIVAPSGYERSWNICAEKSNAPDVEMIDELVTKLQTYSNVNSNKIRVLGSSNGGGLANRIFIENTNSGIDIVCAIVSHLNESQYHAGQFHKPSGATNSDSSHCGYDTPVTPLTSRKYLSISNDNDNLIPYTGGTSSVGVTFLSAETAAYHIAQHNGYTGSAISTGTPMGTPSITEYTYLSGDVTHIKGDAMHSTNAIQKDYIQNYFMGCNTSVSTKDYNFSQFKVYPNPTSNQLQLELNYEFIGQSYALYSITGALVSSDIIKSENLTIDLSDKPRGLYLIRIDDQVIKIVRQ